jgi:hypothetical protein
MNEEFSSKYLLLQQGTDLTKKKKNKKKQVPVRPPRLPIELVYYNQAAINFLFVLILLANFIINIDQGSIAASSIQIKTQLSLNNGKFGVIGSMLYLGILLGISTL